MTDLGILVAFLIFGTISPAVIMLRNRLVTISLFLSWLLSSSQFKINTPSAVNREASFVSKCNFSSSEKTFDASKKCR